jgi:hypothetical protein
METNISFFETPYALRNSYSAFEIVLNGLEKT